MAVDDHIIPDWIVADFVELAARRFDVPVDDAVPLLGRIAAQAEAELAADRQTETSGQTTGGDEGKL